MSIKLIVGLGNPGKEYDQTRHNAGAIWVKMLAEQANETLRPDSKFHGSVTRIFIANRPIHLLIPSTFMNLSGNAVHAVRDYFNYGLDEVLIAHDELDLPPGSIKLKFGGGHGGHNGLRHIMGSKESGRDFYRLRIGIGHPGSKAKVHGHVLSKPGNEDMNLMLIALEEASRSLPQLATGEFNHATKAINSYFQN